MVRSFLLGHPIEIVNDHWTYADTGEPVPEKFSKRPCVHCNQFQGANGHDPCLGEIPGVRNACCGHGVIECAGVQFSFGRPTLRGAAAMKFFKGIGRAE